MGVALGERVLSECILVFIQLLATALISRLIISPPPSTPRPPPTTPPPPVLFIRNQHPSVLWIRYHV